jgi:hypothetical protein
MTSAFDRVLFVTPGVSEQYTCGNLLVTQSAVRLLRKTGLDARILTTHEPAPANDEITIDWDWMRQLSRSERQRLAKQTMFIPTWGPLINHHLDLLGKELERPAIAYYAVSFGHNDLPPNIPVATISKYLLSIWCVEFPGSYCEYIPPLLSPNFYFGEGPREIDVLFHTYKQNRYAIEKLVPALKASGIAVKEIDSWCSQSALSDYMRQSRVFIYLTSLYSQKGEGFGLPAAEAVACGAIVGSNMLGGVTDFLIPGENAIKLQSVNLDFDLFQIKSALASHKDLRAYSARVRETYSESSVTSRWASFLSYCAEMQHNIARRPTMSRRTWKKLSNIWWYTQGEGFLKMAKTHVKQGSSIVIIDDNGISIGELQSSFDVHYLNEKNGVDWGPPEDSESAILQIKQWLDRGMRYIVITWCAYWWKDVYADFFDYLDRVCVKRRTSKYGEIYEFA